MTMFDLTGRRALITGSSQGIGLALARGLANAGAQPVLNGRDKIRLAAAARDVPGARMLAFDATDHAAVQSAVDAFEADVGPIDILVNNAGMQHRAPLETFPADAFARLLQTNIATVFNTGQAVARHMIRRGAGKIINIASVQTALARPGIAPYTATKGAVGNLTKGGIDCRLGCSRDFGAAPGRCRIAADFDTRGHMGDGADSGAVSGFGGGHPCVGPARLRRLDGLPAARHRRAPAENHRRCRGLRACRQLGAKTDNDHITPASRPRPGSWICRAYVRQAPHGC
jgi:NAD(P)-dependent dehydrogenase (short-subunit alcohol dehydrogenase family)